MALIPVSRRPRFWFLLLSALALFKLAQAAPELHKQSQISRYGVRTFGWVTGKGAEKSPIVYYAYRVNAQTHGGQYRLSSLDSDFELIHNGDGVNVIYLSTRPHISEVGDDPLGILRVTQLFCVLWFILFLLGFWLSEVFTRKGRLPSVASSSPS